MGPGSRFFAVIRRVWTGAYYDGFIHAGNLAYMSLLALFPFFIVVAAIFSALGEPAQQQASIAAVLTAVPPMVAKVLAPVGGRRRSRRAAAGCCGRRHWSACGPPAACSRRSATYSTAPMAPRRPRLLALSPDFDRSHFRGGDSAAAVAVRPGRDRRARSRSSRPGSRRPSACSKAWRSRGWSPPLSCSARSCCCSSR